MKNLSIILITAFLFLNTSTLRSQTFEPKQSTVEYNDAIRPCIVVNLDPEPITLKKAWSKFLRKEYNVNIHGLFWNRDVLHSKEINIEQLSPKQLDFYTQIIEDDNGSEMKVFVSFGYDIYLSEADYPSEYEVMNEMLVSFLKEYLPKYYNEGVEDAEKRVKELNKEVASIQMDINRTNNRIENMGKDIEDYNIEIKENTEKKLAAEKKLKAREQKLIRIKNKLEAL